MRKLLKWLDDNLLVILTGFLLLFIPLYPKVPLIDVLPGYIVRIRLEDILIAAIFLLWLYYLLRKKVYLFDNPLLKPILLYLSIGLLSILSAIFITKTVPLEAIHVKKTFLHFFRRVEYFSLFFILFSTVKNLKQLRLYVTIIIFTVFAVSIYGFGQKYLYWPAFSTMNREFAKGWMLYLTEHARVLSTFGGHYDLAAFMMMTLIILWSLFFGIKQLFFKLLVFLVIACAFWTLILTASRTSFIAYLAGLTVMFFFWMFKKGISWSLYRWFTVIFLSIIVMLSFGDLSDRFTRLLKIDERIKGIKSLVLSPIGRPPRERAVFLENNPDALSLITSRSDQPPKMLRPSDVYQDMPLLIPTATDSASLAAVPRTYSQTAFRYDLSTAIRFDALWPMAIKGFAKNPLLGSGYATLNKLQVTDFTEAESTDNDYLRSLGETGILGFVTFYGILLWIVLLVFKSLPVLRDRILVSLAIGLIGVIAGLLVNAVYIDVFESSKVAFSFWSISGIILSAVYITKKNNQGATAIPKIIDAGSFALSKGKKIQQLLKSDRFYLLLILLLAFWLRIYKLNTPLADWHSWRQADTSAVTRNFVKHGVNLLYPTYDDLSNVASGLDNPRGFRMVEFPIYNFLSFLTDKILVPGSVEISGRLTSILASLISIIFLFYLSSKYLGRNVAFLTCLFYAVLPYNIFYSRVILPEPLMVTTSLGMLVFLDKTINAYQKKDSNHSITYKLKIFSLLIITYLLTAISLLIKPFTAFLFLPFAYLWFKGFSIRLKSGLVLFIFLLLALLPFLYWRFWISQFPEGVPAFSWLLNGDGIRFKGAFFYWLFADRLARLILGYYGLPLLLLGLLSYRKKNELFFYLWSISILLYVTIVATGNIRHDYYQILTIPIICIFLAKGIVFLTELIKYGISKLLVFGLLLIVIIFMEMFGWYFIRDFYNINHPEIVEAGSAVERKTHPKALVIAPYSGDTAFLYQTNRSGWPIVQEHIEEMIGKGAQYYVSVNFDDLTNSLIFESVREDLENRKYKLVEKTDKYVIIQLVADNKLPR